LHHMHLVNLLLDFRTISHFQLLWSKRL